jgi:hypothetical protein
MRTLSFALIVQVLGIVTLMPQGPSAPQPYEERDAYQIYSLLLPQEESYGFAKGTLIIQEETASNAAVVGACLSPEVVKQFKDAISDYERSRTKTWLLKRHFQIEKPYEIVNKETLALFRGHGLDSWDDYYIRYPQSGGYVFLSAVGFNKKKTQAIVYTGSICGGLCGRSQFHLLEKVHGQWKEVSGVTCVTVS